jgi:hypothetical protein
MAGITSETGGERKIVRMEVGTEQRLITCGRLGGVPILEVATPA